MHILTYSLLTKTHSSTQYISGTMSTQLSTEKSFIDSSLCHKTSKQKETPDCWIGGAPQIWFGSIIASLILLHFACSNKPPINTFCPSNCQGPTQGKLLLHRKESMLSPLIAAPVTSYWLQSSMRMTQEFKTMDLFVYIMNNDTKIFSQMLKKHYVVSKLTNNLTHNAFGTHFSVPRTRFSNLRESKNSLSPIPKCITAVINATNDHTESQTVVSTSNSKCVL